MNDALAENIELTKAKQQLEIKQRNTNVEIAKLERHAAKLRKDAAGEKDEKKRLALLQRADATEKTIALKRVNLAREDLRIKREQAKQAGNNKKANDELAQSEINLYNVETQYYQKTTGIAKQMRTLSGKTGGGGGKSGTNDLQQQMEEEERLRKEKEKRELQAIRKAQDAKIQLIENGYDREYQQTELMYDRQIEDLKAQMAEFGEDEVTLKAAYDSQIVDLEKLKWKKLAEIRDKEMQDAYNAEMRDYEQRMKGADKLVQFKIKSEEEQKKKEKEAKEERKRAISEALNYALDNLYTFMDAYVEAAEKRKKIADEQVEKTWSVLEAELQARANGYANEVETARKEYEMAKKNQEKALKEQKRAQQAQEALDTAAQVTSLITATANIWKAFTGTGPWGVAAAIAATALMFGSFAAAKVQAMNAAGSGTEEYGEGTVELLQGGSHQGGNDIDLGRKKDGTRRRAEGGEFFAVINKRNSRKYRDLIPEVVNSLNDGTFAEKYMGAYGGDVNVNVQGRNDHLRSLSDDVHQIRQQGETRTFTDARGNTVTSYKNVKRIIKAS